MAPIQAGISKRQFKDLPPGSSKSPIEQISAFFSGPEDFLVKNQHRFGNVFTVRFPAMPPIVYVSDLEFIDFIFEDEGEVFNAGAGNKSAYVHRVLGENSILVQDGKPHRELQIGLAECLRELNQGTYDATFARVAHKVLTAATAKTQFSLLRVAEEISLKVLIDACFGSLLGAKATLLLNLLLELVDLGNHSSRWVVEAPKYLAKIDSILYDQIDIYRSQTQTEKTILSKLVKVTDENGRLLSSRSVRDQLITVLIAGHDSAATTYCWAMYHATHDRRLRVKLNEELTSKIGTNRPSDFIEKISDKNQLIGLTTHTAWVKETLRLHAIVPGIHRMTKRRVQFRNWHIPRGVIVAPAMYLAHRDSSQWDEPEIFKLNREYPAGPNAHFFPFGANPHRCLGSRYGDRQVKMLLAITLGLFGDKIRLKYGYSGKAVRRGVTLAPSDGLPVFAI